MSRSALLALALLVAAPAGAQVAERLDDLRLATAVRLALVGDTRTRPLDVDVVAQDGVVQVEGAVPEADRPAVDAVAREVPGVRAVRRPGEPLDAPGGRVTIPPRPAASAPAPEAAPVGGVEHHVVERGDTLFSLARRYRTTVDEILRLNGLRSPSIEVGQRLRVR